MTETKAQTPSDAELFALIKEHFGLDQRRDDTVINRSTGRFHDAQRYRNFTSAVLAKWGTPPPAPATQQAGERVYAFRRKGLADFCTCDEARYEEVSNKPHLFETRIFYTAPMPVAREPLSDEQIEALPMWKRFVGLWPETRREIVRIIEAQHGIKGGQHGTE